MFKWFYELDRILRGDATRPEQIRDGQVDVPLRSIFASVLILGAVSGLCVGSFALFRGIEHEMLQQTWQQTIASMVKVPALYVLTLLVTFPSLYVFNSLVGSRLKITSVLKLLLAALGVNMAVLSSLGPIVAFFSASTPSYPFIVLLNILVFAISGILGLAFLAQTLSRIVRATTEKASEPRAVRPEFSSGSSPVASLAKSEELSERADDLPVTATLMENIPAPPVAGESGKKLAGPLDRIHSEMIGNRALTVFACWIVVFGLVGAQMSWILRPFIGAPGAPFTLFRPRQSNFFEAAWHTFLNVFF